MAAERLDPDATQRIDDAALGATLAAGQRVFGRYVLECEIGRGGMGVVWRARDETLGETIALKFLPASVARDAVAVDEMKEETRRARRLRHPHIVSVFDFVQDETMVAVSMELVDGTTLAQLRLQQPGKVFSEKTLAPLVPQICASLDYAHHHGKVAHRDLKPANVLVTRDGIAKLADFGIARSLTETHTRLTGKAGTSGTLLYMSPQQLRGHHAAPADDLYALGATLYELLAGKPPFFSGEITHQILHETPEPLSARRAALAPDAPPLPRAWEETIAACLAKEQKDRPQSAGEVAARLAILPAIGIAIDNKTISPRPAAVPKAPVQPGSVTALPKTPPTPSALHYPAPGESWPEERDATPASPLKYSVSENDSSYMGIWIMGGVLLLVLLSYVFGLIPVPRPWPEPAPLDPKAELVAVKGAVEIAARAGPVVTAVDVRGRETRVGGVPPGGTLAPARAGLKLTVEPWALLAAREVQVRLDGQPLPLAGGRNPLEFAELEPGEKRFR